MSIEKQIEEMTKELCDIECKGMKCDTCDGYCCEYRMQSEALYNAGYRKQNDEELIDKIATYFEKEDNWTKLKYSWNACGKSVQLRDMLRDAICGAHMKGGSE